MGSTPAALHLFRQNGFAALCDSSFRSPIHCLSRICSRSIRSRTGTTTPVKTLSLISFRQNFSQSTRFRRGLRGRETLPKVSTPQHTLSRPKSFPSIALRNNESSGPLSLKSPSQRVDSFRGDSPVVLLSRPGRNGDSGNFCRSQRPAPQSNDSIENERLTRVVTRLPADFREGTADDG